MNWVALRPRDESRVYTPQGRGCERRLRTIQTLDRHILLVSVHVNMLRTVTGVNELERGPGPTKTILSVNHFSVSDFFQLCAVSGNTR